MAMKDIVINENITRKRKIERYLTKEMNRKNSNGIINISLILMTEIEVITSKKFVFQK